MAEPDSRPMRADARRNRERILEVALREFTRLGSDATLDAIAKSAGVGAGTLYRHFPTREALVEAVYRNEVARVCDAVPTLLENATPDVALREWMSRFIDYMTTKSGMADALRALLAPGGECFAQSRDRLREAIAVLLDVGVRHGSLRAGVDPEDVLTGLSGIALTSGEPAQRARADRLLDLLMDGLRYHAEAGSAR
jgi:AcrR family transcriptional regulator